MKKLISNPAMILFVSANVINVGNLGFNVLFSRLLGPVSFGDLALLFTIMLSILSVLNAVQFEIAGRIAGLSGGQERAIAGTEINRVSRYLILGMVLFLILFFTAAWFFIGPNIGSQIAEERIQSYIIFAFALPFMAPLCAVRGWAQGALSIKKIVLSGQMEMLVRFGGGIIAWVSGAGLPGITLAIVLSVVAGWYFARPDKKIGSGTAKKAEQHPSFDGDTTTTITKGLFWAALPWACLQFGQVLALDGDFLVAKMQLDSTQAGLSAVTVLVQRVVFFGCFGLATALLPMAVNLKSQQEIRSAINPIILLVLLTCIPVISGMLMVPELFVVILFGHAFDAVAPSLSYAAISGSCFVVIYLIATFFLARSRKYFGYLVLILAILQVVILSLIPLLYPGADMHVIASMKALVQIGFLITISGFAAHEFAKLPPT